MERNRHIRHAIAAGALLAGAALGSSCSYAELPPRTGDATTTYVVPAGVLPSAAEKDQQKAAKDEYESFLKNQ